MLNLVPELSKNENDLLQFSLDELVRMGAKRLLIHALNQEVEEYITENSHWIDENGRRMVVRNGEAHKSRKITTGAGILDVKPPRVNDKRPGLKFTSKILPPYLRKSANVESVIPILYLKGLSGNAFNEALESLLGERAKGLSSSSISALKRTWDKELKDWNQRAIEDEFVYLWADGVNVKVRLGEDKKVCLLVVVGVNQNGDKKLLAVTSGFRESELGWKQVFLNLISRGLKAPKLITGDGGLGLWSAIAQLEEFKNTKQQRCWVHKIANVLDALPKKQHPKAKEALHEIMNAASKKDAELALRTFKEVFGSKYPKACEKLDKDWDKLITFFNFPASHWKSIKTSNPIESAFATVKLRTKTMKGAGSLKAAEVMAFKLLCEAEKKWRKIRGWQMIEELLKGTLYIDGEKVDNLADQQGVA